MGRNLKRIKAADTGRVNPHDDVVRHVRNQSSRNGARVQLIVLHDTEGANIKGVSDLKGLGDWFDKPAAQASAHVGVDAEGHSARFVDDASKAWHVAFYNSVSLGVEQVGFATQRSWPNAQVEEVARWIARWADLHNIPIRKGKVSSDGRVLRSGVVLHSQLGSLGGGHHDPGKHYPFKQVLRLARGFLHLRQGR